jgi:hypothetical protein
MIFVFARFFLRFRGSSAAGGSILQAREKTKTGDVSSVLRVHFRRQRLRSPTDSVALDTFIRAIERVNGVLLGPLDGFIDGRSARLPGALQNQPTLAHPPHHQGSPPTKKQLRCFPQTHGQQAIRTGGVSDLSLIPRLASQFWKLVECPDPTGQHVTPRGHQNKLQSRTHPVPFS